MLGKYADPSNFRLAPQDMVPIIYKKTAKVKPLIEVLQKEHTDITRLHGQHPNMTFTEVTQKYYEREEKKERDKQLKRML